MILSTFSTALELSESSTVMVRAPSSSNNSFDMSDAGVSRAQDRGDADAVLRRKLRQRRQRGEAYAAAQHHDVLPLRLAA